MDCKHEKLKCVDNVFFCLSCGAKVPNPFEAHEPPKEENTPAKRGRKKGEKKDDS